MYIHVYVPIHVYIYMYTPSCTYKYAHVHHVPSKLSWLAKITYKCTMYKAKRLIFQFWFRTWFSFTMDWVYLWCTLYYLQATHSLFVGNIPKNISVYELRDIFQRFGDVVVSFQVLLSWSHSFLFSIFSNNIVTCTMYLHYMYVHLHVWMYILHVYTCICKVYTCICIVGCGDQEDEW